jgi:hypothetical protein
MAARHPAILISPILCFKSRSVRSLAWCEKEQTASQKNQSQEQHPDAFNKSIHIPP